MGTDIHFVIERQDRDGNWLAVYSKAYAYMIAIFEHGFTMPEPTSLPGISFQLSNRNYDIFSVLSRVRCDTEEGSHVMQSGLPDDISEYTSLNYQNDFYLHSIGHGTLAELHAALSQTDAETGQSIYCDSEDNPASDALLGEVAHVLDMAEAIATRAADDKVILRGLEYDADTDTRFPDMGLSGHARLAAAAAADMHFGRLAPISPNTVRLIVAYDN